MQDAANIINDYTIPHLSAMHSLVELEKLKTTKEKYEEGEVPALQSSPSDSAFTKQLINKINFNYLVVKSINEALKVIQESKGWVTIVKYSLILISKSNNVSVSLSPNMVTYRSSTKNRTKLSITTTSPTWRTMASSGSST